MYQQSAAHKHTLPQKVINSLVGLSKISELDNALVKVMDSGTISDRFIMKMEINRLRKPCVRRIDMRDKINADCQLYLHESVTHFLTTQAISLFEEMIKVYQGIYTIGVFECVFSELDNLIKPADFENKSEVSVSASEYELFNVEKMGFGLYQTRSENRVFFSTEVLVSTNNQEFTTSTSDISCDGVRILLPEDCIIIKNQLINLKFSGLKRQYVDKTLDAFVSYKVVGIDKKDDKIYIRAIRIDKIKSINTFFNKFIAAQQVFQRIDSSDTAPILLNKGYEMLYAQKSTGLPIFFSDKDKMEHLLVSDNNKHILQHFKNHVDRSALPFAITKPLLDRARQQDDSSAIIYTIKYQKDSKIIFLSSSHSELVEKNLLSTFIGFALNKGELKVFKLKVNPISTDYSKFGLENDGLSNVSVERINRIKNIGVLHDITTKSYIEDLRVLATQSVIKSVSELRKFMLKGQVAAIDIVPANFVSKRKNLRYLYKMEIQANHDDTCYKGNSSNFSTEGLSVDLTKPIKAVTGDTINIIIPSSTLKSQPYRIVRMNVAKTTIHLRMTSDSHTEENKLFMEELIKSNQKNLKADYGPNHSKGLLDGLCRLYCRFGSLSVMFLSQKKHTLSVKRYVTSFNNDLNQLMSSCSNNKLLANTYPLIASKLGNYLQSEEFLKLLQDGKYKKSELFICVNYKNEHLCVTTKLSSELSSTKIRKLFVENARRRGVLFVVQAHSTKTNPLDLSFVAAHLSKLKRYAHYHINDVQKELTSIFAAVNLVDITKASLLRLGVVQ